MRVRFLSVILCIVLLLCANSLNNTVQAVLDWCGDRDDTAILITADHETGGLSVSTQEEFDNRYAASSGNAFYYQWTTEEHTKTPVSVYAYGFDPDFAAYYLDGNEALIKNTAVFQIMLELLKK